MEHVSLREFGRRKGVSLNTVQHGIDTGRIIRLDNGKIEWESQSRAWDKNATPKSFAKETRRDKARTGKPLGKTAQLKEHPQDAAPPAAAPPPSDVPDDAGRAHGDEDKRKDMYQTARASREVIEAQMAKLKLEREQGLLCDKSGIEQAGFASGRALRDGLMSAIDRLAPTLAAETDRHAVTMILTNEFTRLLEDLNANLKRLLDTN